MTSWGMHTLLLALLASFSVLSLFMFPGDDPNLDLILSVRQFCHVQTCSGVEVECNHHKMLLGMSDWHRVSASLSCRIKLWNHITGGAAKEVLILSNALQTVPTKVLIELGGNTEGFFYHCGCYMVTGIMGVPSSSPICPAQCQDTCLMVTSHESTTVSALSILLASVGICINIVDVISCYHCIHCKP